MNKKPLEKKTPKGKVDPKASKGKPFPPKKK
jgi:hypothetical protein